MCERRISEYLGNNAVCNIDSRSIERKGSIWLRYDEHHLISSVLVIAVELYVVPVKTITALLWEAPNVYPVPPDTLSFG